MSVLRLVEDAVSSSLKAQAIDALQTVLLSTELDEITWTLLLVPRLQKTNEMDLARALLAHAALHASAERHRAVIANLEASL